MKAHEREALRGVATGPGREPCSLSPRERVGVRATIPPFFALPHSAFFAPPTASALPAAIVDFGLIFLRLQHHPTRRLAAYGQVHPHEGIRGFPSPPAPGPQRRRPDPDGPRPAHRPDPVVREQVRTRGATRVPKVGLWQSFSIISAMKVFAMADAILMFEGK